ncbi:MAG: PPOX class F420-dependent oxidoreductase [Acidimicrobiia bacterium]
MRTMAPEEAIAFLGEGTRTGKLATTTHDGSPHVTPIWFVVDGSDVVFNTWHTGQKSKHLHRDPRAALVVDLEEPPYGYVLVRGTVSISTNLNDVRRFATLIGARYMGDDRAEEFGERNGVEGELLIRLHMDRIVGHADVTA